MEPFPDYYDLPIEFQVPDPPLDDSLLGQESEYHADAYFHHGQHHTDTYFHHGQHQVSTDFQMHGVDPGWDPYQPLWFTAPVPDDYHHQFNSREGLPDNPPPQYGEAYSTPDQWEWQQHQGHPFGQACPERMPHFELSHIPEPQDAELQALEDAAGLSLLPARLTDPSQVCTPAGLTNPSQVCTPSDPSTPAVKRESSLSLSVGPPVQESPTPNSTSGPRQRRRGKRIDKDLPLEEQIKLKQEAYREKAARKRQEIFERQQRSGASSTSRKTQTSPTDLPVSEPVVKKTRKRKADSILTSLVLSTPPPRPQKLRADLDQKGRSEMADSDDAEAHAHADSSPLQRYSSCGSLSSRAAKLRLSSNDRPKRQRRPTPPERDWDALSQPILTNYECYRWTVTRYTLDPANNFPYAQAFLDALARITLVDHLGKFRWASHTTRGFIKNGTRFSLLVLHNATNPFTWEPKPATTTTIGVYGRYWYKHAEIHWTTFAPGIADVLTHAVQQGIIAPEQRWRYTTDPAERYFHRAYWHAANRLPLHGLLDRRTAAANNVGNVVDDVDDDVPDEPWDDDFEVSELDLQDAFAPGVTWASVEEAKAIWERAVEDLDLWGGAAGGAEHVDTGGSEMEDYA